MMFFVLKSISSKVGVLFGTRKGAGIFFGGGGKGGRGGEGCALLFVSSRVFLNDRRI